MKKILVSGGAGFIGSHLCTRLINEGHHVICLDNLFTGVETNIEHLKNNSHFEFVNHDVEFPYLIEGLDEIYNLACPASPIHYQYDAIKTIKTSVLGAINMLGLAKKTNAKILQASTSEVYGDPIGIRSCYDEGKRCSETLFMDYHRQNNIRIKIIRIFNTYGPRMLPNDGRVVSNFVVQALQNHDITIYGTGDQTRSFQYIDDLIEGMVRMMNTEDEFIGPVNLGNPNEFSILELAEKVIQLTGSKSKLVFKPLPHDDPKQRQPDITLAKEKLNWQPTIELEDGLQKIVEYFKEYRYRN